MKLKIPDLVFEISWEVCNMVGGIHTVIQSKATQMREQFGDNYICVGPQIPHTIGGSPVFRDEVWDDEIYKFIQDLSVQGITCRMGRWNIPGEPKTFLIGFTDLFHRKDQILAQYWEHFKINSLFGGYDYVEPVLFSHAAGLLIEQLHHRFFIETQKKVVVHAHEWMTAISLLHLKTNAPEVSLVFTTHATILGRSLSSIAQQKNLNSYIQERSAFQWAQDVGIESKHSVETTAALESDCFTTVSQTTAEECEIILSKKPDFVVHNGLSAEVPAAILLEQTHKNKMRRRLLQIAGEVNCCIYDPETTYITVTSGRYEFHNKGINLYLEALMDLRDFHRSNSNNNNKRPVKTLAFIMCPAGNMPRLPHVENSMYCTHPLTEPDSDPTLNLLKRREQTNSVDNPVDVIFIPIYLNGSDLTFPDTYWNLLSGVDLAVFPSWYEPWGYTPHEAISLGIPTITTDCAGFGRWAEDLPGTDKSKGVVVIPRLIKGRNPSEENYESARKKLTAKLLEFQNLSLSEKEEWSKAAFLSSKKIRWNDLISGYMKAYSFAIEKTNQRVANHPSSKFRSFSLGRLESPSRFSNARANVRHFSVSSRFHGVLESMIEFAQKTMNWKWNPHVTELLHRLDPELWEIVDHDPVKFIKNISEDKMQLVLTNKENKKILDSIIEDFEAYPKHDEFERAYFCMEYGITDELKIYSGGLGILSGDHLKTVSNMKIPLVAFGLFYQYGYFRQSFGKEGQQIANFDRSELENLKLTLVQDDNDARVLLNIPLGDEKVYFQVWQLDFQYVQLYLLDSNIIENPTHLRGITDRLYSTEKGRRLQQEWLLSIGGLELINHLKLKIRVYHMNEGHTAMLVIGRTLEFMKKEKLSFEEAFDMVRFTTLFTTHTPVPAGHEEFPMEDTVRLLRNLVTDPELYEKVVKLGSSIKQGSDNKFSMTSLALRGSRWVNAVSKIHGDVSRRMFNNLYPELDSNEVPVTHVTNGVHVPFWLDSAWQNLFCSELDQEWHLNLCKPNFWKHLEKVPHERIYEIKVGLKNKLIQFIRTRLEKSLNSGNWRPEYAEVLAKLSDRTLIITHAKRMTPYKRADLLFQNPERFHQLIKNSPAPLLFIYSGKAHPSDGHGQEILQKLNNWSRDPRFRGHILILEDYDLSFAKKLLTGSDIWLNTPIRPLEASGTSGMKAAINGTLHFSVADGWWPEAYNGKNGWMLGNGSELWDANLQDSYDLERIYHLLESEIIPTFMPPRGLTYSPRWAEKIRECIISNLPFVASERMINDYEENLYKPALKASYELEKNNYSSLKKLNSAKKIIQENWHQVTFLEIETDNPSIQIARNENLDFKVFLQHPNINPELLSVQGVLHRKISPQLPIESSIIPFECLTFKDGGQSEWKLKLDNKLSGDYSLAVRVKANLNFIHEDPGFELKFLKWL